MGNCVGSRFALCKKVSPDDDDEYHDQELKGVSAVVAGKIISSALCSDVETAPVSGEASPPPLSVLLKSGELQHGLQVQIETAGDSCQKMKIVVNRKQLQLLKRRLEELRLGHVVVHSIRKKGKKWRPSLATIPEV